MALREVWLELLGITGGCMGLYVIAVIWDLRTLRLTLARVHSEGSNRSLAQTVRYLTSLGEWYAGAFYESTRAMDALAWELSSDSLRQYDFSPIKNAGEGDAALCQQILLYLQREFRCVLCAIVFGESATGEIVVHPPLNERNEALFRRYGSHLFMQEIPLVKGASPTVRRFEERTERGILSFHRMFGVEQSLVAYGSTSRGPCTLWLGYPMGVVPSQTEQRALKECMRQCIEEIDRRRALQSLSHKVAEVEQQHTEKEKMMLHFSHDIRSPLNNVRSVLSLLHNDATTIEMRELITSALSNCDAVSDVVSSLIDFLRHRSGQLYAKSEHCYGGDIVREVVQAFALSARTKGILLQFEESSPALLQLDLQHFKRAITNLLSNAVKYTTQGSVTVITRVVANRFEVIIRDTGIGMSKEDVEKLFTPFTRFTTLQDGVGIGLAVTKLLIELNGGSISITSEYGKGTECVVRFPIAEEQKGSSSTMEMPVVKEQEVILLVDDEPEALLAITRVLEMEQYHVVKAFSVSEAIGICSLITPTVVISDLHVGRGKVEELFEAVLKKNAQVRLATLSGDEPTEMFRKRFPLEKIFIKPIDPKQIQLWIQYADLNQLKKRA